MLCLSLFKSNDDCDIGDFVVLYPEMNEQCQNAVDLYSEKLSTVEDGYFEPLTLERLVGAIEKYVGDEWVWEFRERYLFKLNE